MDREELVTLIKQEVAAYLRQHLGIKVMTSQDGWDNSVSINVEINLENNCVIGDSSDIDENMIKRIVKDTLRGI